MSTDYRTPYLLEIGAVHDVVLGKDDPAAVDDAGGLIPSSVQPSILDAD